MKTTLKWNKLDNEEPHTIRDGDEKILAAAQHLVAVATDPNASGAKYASAIHALKLAVAPTLGVDPETVTTEL